MMDPLSVWFSVLVKPDYVRVFEYGDEVVWTDGVALARVPPPLLPEVDPGCAYTIKIDDIALVTKSFNENPIREALEGAVSSSRVRLDNDIKNSEEREILIKGDVVKARKYKTAKKGDSVFVNEKVHTILFSAVRRGAELFTNKARSTVMAKIDGELVAWAAVIKVGKGDE